MGRVRLISILFLLLFKFSGTYGQSKKDSVKFQFIDTVSIETIRLGVDIKQLDSIKGTYIFSGKKSEVIELTKKTVAISEKYGRQIFAKIPGVFVYDMDGTGNQVNISVRGLDPHRGWEFNIRKDGILTNSDMYGYPASHYNIPMEAVERIELVRGTGSLQYGAQFGGMLNYVSKQPENKPLSFESINTIGSYGLLSNYNAISGTIGKFRYSAWVNKKWITGYRQNSESNFDAEAISLFYDASKNLHFKLDWTRSNYVTQLAGPLTDSMFHLNPKMATRSRNYYNPVINIPSLTVNWNIAPKTKLQFTVSAVIGARNSVLFDKPATVTDSIVKATLQYNNRQVDIDHFNSYTSELRLIHTYKFHKLNSTFTAGVQGMNNNLHRQQLGKGTTGSDFDLTLVKPGWGRDLHYKTNNIAVFIENRWVLSRRFSINTGARIEQGNTKMTGVTSYYSDSALPTTIKHSIPLFGAGAQYDLGNGTNFYGGWSQSYRPVIFKDIIPASVYEVTDKNLKDAYGYNAEIGFRGKFRFLKWDVSLFQLQYNNRLGTLAQTDSKGNLIIFRTNIGNSQTRGIELFLEGDVLVGKKMSLSLFTSSSYMNAHYQNAKLKSGNENVSINGNSVESTPHWISRNGFTVKYLNLSLNVLYSYVSSSFADALNTVEPSSTGASGLVPAYGLLDMNFAIRLTERIKFQLNANNVLNRHYFTKRPQFYPGPGIWPSDGRTFSGTFSIRI